MRSLFDSENGIRDDEREIADYSAAVSLDPEYVEAYQARGKAYLYKGEYDKAISDFDKVVSLDAESYGAYLSRAEAHYRKCDYSNAIENYSKTIDLFPERAFLARYQRGLAYLEKGDHENAVADLDEVIRHEITDYYDHYYSWGRAHFKRAFAHAFLGSEEIANLDLKKAQELGCPEEDIDKVLELLN